MQALQKSIRNMLPTKQSGAKKAQTAETAEAETAKAKAETASEKFSPFTARAEESGESAPPSSLTSRKEEGAHLRNKMVKEYKANPETLSLHSSAPASAASEPDKEMSTASKKETTAAKYNDGVVVTGFSHDYAQVIQELVEQDNAYMEVSAVSVQHITNPDNKEKVKTACKNIMQATKELFTNPQKRTEKLTAFVQSEIAKKPQDEQLLKQMGIELPITEANNKKIDEAINKMAKNLGSYFYHTINHANEMYTDTVARLKASGESDSFCEAGGMIAHEHDLVQGLGGFPSRGENENVTAKLVNYIMQEANPDMDKEVLKALKDLSDATIVGGTNLTMIKVNGEPKNKAFAQFVNYDEMRASIAPENKKGLDSIISLRGKLAVNDTDRTRETFEKYTPPEDSDASIKKACLTRNNAIDSSNTAIIKSKVFQKFEGIKLEGDKSVRINELSRMCQSIRMIAELEWKGAGPPPMTSRLPERSIVLAYVTVETSLTTEQKEILENLTDDQKTQLNSFIGTKIKKPQTWNEKTIFPDGRIADLSELGFAKPSGHSEYAEFLSSSQFMPTMSALTPDETKELLLVALKTGQAGEYMKVDDLLHF